MGAPSTNTDPADRRVAPSRTSRLLSFLSAPFGLRWELWQRLGGVDRRAPYLLVTAAALVFVLAAGVDRFRSKWLFQLQQSAGLSMDQMRLVQMLVDPILPLAVLVTLFSVRRWRALRADPHLRPTTLAPLDFARLTVVPLVAGIAIVVLPMLWLWMITNTLPSLRNAAGAPFNTLGLVAVRFPPALFYAIDVAIVAPVLVWWITARHPTAARALLGWFIAHALLRTSTTLVHAPASYFAEWFPESGFGEMMLRVTVPGAMRLALQLLILLPFWWTLLRIWREPISE